MHLFLRSWHGDLHALVAGDPPRSEAR
jgi:hypothetical protein